MINFPFTITEPDIWLKNHWLYDQSGGHAADATASETFPGLTTWEDSGVGGYADWIFDADAILSRVQRSVTVTANGGSVPECDSPAGIEPTSVTIGLVIHARSGNNEEEIFGKTGALMLKHPNTDEAEILINGTETIFATDGIADIGGFDDPRMIIIRFQEGGSNGTLDVWVDGYKVIDAVSTTETSLNAGTGRWTFGSGDHRFGEVFMYESAISDADVDYWFGHWAWEHEHFAIQAWQEVLDPTHEYAEKGPYYKSLDDSNPAGSLIVWGDGEDVVVKLKREVSSGVYGTWSEDGWSWDEVEANLIQAMTIKADGVVVPINRLKRQSTPKSQNANAAILDPHVTDNDFVSVGNELEFSLVLATPIKKDQIVTWSITADVFTEGADGNGAITDQKAHANDSLLVDDFINDRCRPDCTVTFVSKTGTVPKLPDLEAGLTADHTYALNNTITMTDINGNSNILFAVDITAGATAQGVIFEVGDQTNGGIIAWVDSSQVLTVVAGTGATRAIWSYDLVEDSVSNFLNTDDATTIGIHINGTQIDVYWEGALLETEAGTDPSGWTAGVSDGRFGGVNGDYVYSDILTLLPASDDITLSELRVYENPTLAIALGTKDYRKTPSGLNPKALYEGTAWESDYTDYIYYKDDIADLTSPGVINKCSNITLARQLLNRFDGFGFGLDFQHNCLMFESGQTWVIGTDTEPYFDGNPLAGLASNDVGETPDRGDVRGIFNGTAGPVFDFSANGLRAIGVRAFMFVQPGFEFEGAGDSTDSSCYQGAPQDGAIFKDSWYSGAKFTNCGDSGIALSQNDEAGPADKPNQRNMVFGLMCFDQISLANSRGAAISIAGPDEGESLELLKFQKSYWGAQYNGGGFSNQQAHGFYTKGWVPYCWVNGGWIPTGPGGMAKSDSMKDTVFEDFVGWDHKGSFGMHNNGTKNGTIWAATTDRSIRAGRHGQRVLMQDFVADVLEDFVFRTVSHVHSEHRRGMVSAQNDQSGPFFGSTGTSNAEGEYGGDSWYTGMSHMTGLSRRPWKLQLAHENDRTLEQSYGAHFCHLNRCLMSVHDPINDDCLRMENGTSSDSYDTIHGTGGVTNFKVFNSHMSGLLQDVDSVDISLATAKTTWTAGGGVLDANSTNADVTFNSVALNTDPLLEYFISEGYASFAAVETALVNAWNGTDWDSVPEALKTEVIRERMAARFRPTNLTATDYDNDQLPGYIVPQISSYNPAVGASGVSDAVTPTLQFDIPIRAGYGMITFYRTGDTVIDSVDIRDCTINSDTELVCTGIDLTGETGVYAQWGRGTIYSKDGGIPLAPAETTTDWYWSHSGDATPPTVTNYSPTIGSTNASITGITLQMSETVVEGTGNLYIRRVSDQVNVATGVAADLVINAGVEVRWSTVLVLDEGEEYDVIYDAGVVEDLAGNAFAGFTAGAFRFSGPDDAAANRRRRIIDFQKLTSPVRVTRRNIKAPNTRRPR